MRRWMLLLLLLALGPAVAEAQPGTTYQPANPWMFVTGTTIRTVPSITEVRLPAAVPLTNDGAALGSSTRSWSDLFLASGGVVNFNNGDVTLTHSTDALTVAGGQLLLPDGTAAAPSLAGVNDTDTGFRWRGSALTGVLNGANVFDIQASHFQLASNVILRWSSTTSAFGSDDLDLLRDAADTLSQRRGTNAQESRIENTFTDASNREFVSLGWANNASAFTIEVEALGTGTARELVLGQIAESTRIRSDLATPASPTLVNGDWWVACSGTSPNRNCSIFVRDTDATRTIATSASF